MTCFLSSYTDFDNNDRVLQVTYPNNLAVKNIYFNGYLEKLVDGNGRAFSYYSFDKVKQITKGSLYSEFKYGANRARYYKKDKRTENGLNTYYYTAYVGGYEKIHRTGGGKATLTEHKVNLGNIVITSRSDGTNDEHYLHKDHLGSAISVTDKTGAVVQQFTYDPWGKQTRIYQTSVFSNLTYNQPTNRGYTGHEMIDGLDIVHMNGRIYDTNIGRFMQADPNIQSAGNFQNYNRYSYVLNNPLSMTDPSGFFFKKLFKSIKKYWRVIAAIVITVYLGPAAAAYFNSTIIGGAVTGFIAGGVATGSLRGALVGAVTGAMFGGLHGVEAGVGKVALHGMAGGIGSVLNGGKFGHGFFAAGFTQAMGGIKGLFAKAPQGMDRLSNAIKAAVIGGTASVISGGKFASGAVTGAFSRLLNDDAIKWDSVADKEILTLDDIKAEISLKAVGQKIVGFDGNVTGPEVSGENVSMSKDGMSVSVSTGPLGVSVDSEGNISVSVSGCSHGNSGVCLGVGAKVGSPMGKAIGNNTYKAMTPVVNQSTGVQSSYLERWLGKLDIGVPN